ncbi:MAG TPA: PDZ domain-containing protein [bacterium]|nr:PDZ domain-containing protein [bacterium]
MRAEQVLTIIVLLVSAGIASAVFFVGTIDANPLSDRNQTQTIDPNTSFADFYSPVDSAADRLFEPPRREASDAPPAPHPPWESPRYGIILKGTAGSEMAVILNAGTGAETVVRPGDTIGNVRIVSIRRNRLELDGPLGSDILERPSEPSTLEPAGSGSITGVDSISPGVPESSAAIRVIERSELQTMVGQVDRLGSEISLQPVRDAVGRSAGFRVTALKPRGTLARMGLRRHDILVSVNHQQIVSLEDVFRVLESAAHETTLTLSILRNKTEMELNYVIR